MLPEDFQWERSATGTMHLSCRGRPLAHVSESESGLGVVCLYPQVTPQYRWGRGGIDAGMAYVERWATQHLARILEIVDGYEARAAYDQAERAKAPKVEIPQTTHHRRSRKSRLGLG
jgi:hypothetical protein